MKILYIDKQTLEISFENDEELLRFNQYFTRDKRQAKWNKGKNGGANIKFYTTSYKIRVQLWKEVYKLCIEYDFKFDFPEQHKLYEEVTLEEVVTFCREQLKDTQYEDFDMNDTFHSVYLAILNKHMKMDLSVSYGKSIFIYLLSKFLILKKINVKILVTTPTPQLSMQIMGEFSEVNKSGFPFTVWRGGGVKNRDAPVVISNFQYLINVKEEILSTFDVVIHDECHRTSAYSYKEISNKCKGVTSTKGVTGSLDEDGSAEEFMVTSQTGALIKTVSKRDLINAGRATDGVICFVILSYLPTHIRQKLIDDRYNPSINKIRSLDAERNEILKYDWRLKILCSFVSKIYMKNGNGIVFFNTIAYGTMAVDVLKKMLPDCRIFYVDKDTSTKNREMFYKYANENDNCIIVGSYGTMSTGVSINNLHWGLALEPFKSFNTIEQVIGRFMRLLKGKDKFVFYDIVDDGRIKLTTEAGVKIKENYLYGWMKGKTEDYKRHEFQIIHQKLSINSSKKKKEESNKSIL